MMKDLSILIPARAGSKRILNKNIVNLNGRPLVSYVIKASLRVTSEVYVSTDSQEIACIAKKYGAKIIIRPLELATDEASTNSVIEHFLKTIDDVEYFACVQPTSPFLKHPYLEKGFKKLKESEKDSIISVYEEKQFYWDKGGNPVNFEIRNKPRTQDMEGVYVENGAFYITSKDSFFKNKSLVGENIGFIEMLKIDSVDIDTYEDLFLTECILKNQKSSFKVN